MAVKQDQESIKRKIHAMLSRAQHPNTPVPEAELCMQQAQKLMIKYSLNQANIESEMTGEYQTRPSTFELYIPAPFIKQKSELLSSICQIFNCTAVRNQFVEDGHALATVFGFESDTDSVWTLFQSLHLQMVDALYDQEQSSVTFRKSFISSYTGRVYGRMMDYYKEELSESEAGTDLVLANRMEDVKALQKETFPDTRTSKQTKINDYDAARQGRDAGNKADITLTSRKITENEKAMINA